MIVLITIALLAFTAATVAVVRIARPGFGFSWLVAAIGALLAWISTFVWQVSLPQTLALGQWLPQSLFIYSPSLLADRINFPFALGLTSLALAIIWTSAARSTTTSPLAWISTLALTALGLIAVLAGNVLTLLLALAAIDLLELVNTLRVAEDPVSSENAVITFSVQLIGLGLITLATVVAYAAGTALNFEAMPPQGSLYLLLGVGVRIAAALYRQPNTREPELRRGYGTAVRLISAAASLSVLARIPAESIPPTANGWLLFFAALAGLLSGVSWLRAPDPIGGRRFFLAGMGALAFAAALRGNGIGSAAWGSALIFCGGLASLYSIHQRRLTIILIAAGFTLTALPFSLTASGWDSTVPSSWAFWILLVPIQALMLAGYVSSIVRSSEASLENQPNWARSIYPAGLVVLGLSGLSLGLFGWAGALQIGVWPAALAATLLGGSLGWFFWRVPGLQRAVRPAVQSGERVAGASAPVFHAISTFTWGIYRTLGRVGSLVARTLEGDGGLLWTLVILALFLSFFGTLLR
jgi:hypothetical protein